MQEPKEQPQENKGFGYTRGRYESPIKTARKIYGKTPLKELLEERSKSSSFQEKDEVSKKIKRRKEERRKVIEELRRLEDIGYRDELTGIYNRGGFEKRLKEETARIKRTGSNAVIFVIDLNNLKTVNDIGGHQAGDEHIKNAAITIASIGRPSDVVARTGGDEFGIILTGSDIEGAMHFWERLKTELGKKSISLAAGVSPLDPNEVEESRNLADIAMYKAKSQGKEESRLETAYNLTAEEIEGGSEKIKKEHSLR